MQSYTQCKVTCIVQSSIPIHQWHYSAFMSAQKFETSDLTQSFYFVSLLTCTCIFDFLYSLSYNPIEFEVLINIAGQRLNNVWCRPKEQAFSQLPSPQFQVSRRGITVIDPLYKWRLNLKNNTWYILSLTFM